MRYVEPFVPVPEDVVPQMLKLASLVPDETLYDLGSGNGRIVLAAAKLFHAKVVGVEFRKGLAQECRKKARELGLSKRVKILCRSFRSVSLRKADVVALYLSSYTLSLLAPKFTKELRRGARVVTFDFSIPDWTAACELNVTPKGWKTVHQVYLYRM